jgi:hypothetical protein
MFAFKQTVSGVNNFNAGRETRFDSEEEFTERRDKKENVGK